MDLIYELSDEEQKWWAKTIADHRKNIIKPPSEYLKFFLEHNKYDIKEIRENVSSFIGELREHIWSIYIVDEIDFHQSVISYLVQTRELPNVILKNVIKAKLFSTKDIEINENNIHEKLALVVGEYAGRIMPYLYELSLSTTNSRRSRAGKTFEAIIKYVIDAYGYPFDDQASLGSEFYKNNGLKKMVDGILPGAKEYEVKRDKCLVITMKTTLRERWQEVVEELNRTNIPNIYLLTVDEGLSEDTLKTMGNHNITVVDYAKVKKQFPNQKNIISFDELFNEEIPHVLNYWRR